MAALIYARPVDPSHQLLRDELRYTELAVLLGALKGVRSGHARGSRFHLSTATLRHSCGPSENYELMGDVPGVVFPCGMIHQPDSDELRLYYGAADSCVALATASLSEVLSFVVEHGEEDSTSLQA